MMGLRRRSRPTDTANWTASAMAIIARLKRSRLSQPRRAILSASLAAALRLALRAVTTAVRPFLGLSLGGKPALTDTFRMSPATFRWPGAVWSADGPLRGATW